jgi:hypothetical protein
MGPGITYSHLFSEIEGIEGVQNGSGDQLKDSMRSKKKGRGVDNTMSRVGR